MREHDFKAVKLTEEQIEVLRKARKKAADAQAELDRVERVIRLSHGQTERVTSDLVHRLGRTDVELRGDWALITTRRAK